MTFNFSPFAGVKDAWTYREEPENMRALGQYLWRALLILALLAILSAAWLGYQQLLAVQQAENTAPTPSAPPAPLDPNALQAQMNTFTATQNEYQVLSRSPLPQIPDPAN